MDLLGEQVDNSWKEKHLNLLAGSEGVKGTDDSVESGGKTRAYGITVIPKALESVADSLSDKELATRIIDHNHNRLRAMGIDFDNLPEAMKINASDLMYNTGTLFNNYRSALDAKDFPTALRESLDVVSATDPDQNMDRKVVRGLVNRRMQMYNEAADELGLSRISDNKIFKSQTEGALTDVVYNFEGDKDPIIFNIDKGMHTKSFSDERPEGYDIRKPLVSSPLNDIMEMNDPDYEEYGYDLTPIVPDGTPSYMNLLGE